MKSLGIEFDSNKLHYVLIKGSADDFKVVQGNRFTLGDTRSPDALMAFQDAIKTLFNSTAPDIIAIKEKPESGRMRAGSASLKMEALTLANSPCRVVFISGARINKCGSSDQGLYGYLQPALKAAVITLEEA